MFKNQKHFLTTFLFSCILCLSLFTRSQAAVSLPKPTNSSNNTTEIISIAGQVVPAADSPQIFKAASKKVSLSPVSLTTVTRKGSDTTIQWTKNSNATGYQIQYSQDSKFKNASKKTVSGASSLKKTLTLDKSKNYYIRVRAYKKSGSQTIYSSWSSKCRVIGWKSSLEFASNAKIHSDSVTKYFTGVSSDKKKNITVCINAGHGTKGGSSVYTLCHPDGSPKVTGGTTASGATKAIAVSEGMTFSDGTSEASVTLALAMQVKEELLAAGYHVLMIRESADAQIDNIARTVYANNYADLHIALHYDSTNSNKGAFYISVPSSRTYRNMYPVNKHYQKHDALGKALLQGLRAGDIKIFSSGSMEIDLTQTSYSTVPSIDLEVGDKASSHSDAALKKLAQAIATGVKNYK